MNFTKMTNTFVALPVQEFHELTRALVRNDVDLQAITSLSALGAHGDKTQNLRRHFERCFKHKAVCNYLKLYTIKIAIKRSGRPAEVVDCPMLLPHELQTERLTFLTGGGVRLLVTKLDCINS
jgi:hypothetical protein